MLDAWGWSPGSWYCLKASIGHSECMEPCSQDSLEFWSSRGAFCYLLLKKGSPPFSFFCAPAPLTQATASHWAQLKHLQMPGDLFRVRPITLQCNSLRNAKQPVPTLLVDLSKSQSHPAGPGYALESSREVLKPPVPEFCPQGTWFHWYWRQWQVLKAPTWLKHVSKSKNCWAGGFGSFELLNGESLGWNWSNLIFC